MSCVYLRSLRQAHMCLSGLSLLVYQNKMRSICYFLLCVCGVHLCVPISTSRFCSAVFPGVFILLWFPPVYILCPPPLFFFHVLPRCVCSSPPPLPVIVFAFVCIAFFVTINTINTINSVILKQVCQLLHLGPHPVWVLGPATVVSDAEKLNAWI